MLGRRESETIFGAVALHFVLSAFSPPLARPAEATRPRTLQGPGSAHTSACVQGFPPAPARSNHRADAPPIALGPTSMPA